MRSGTFAPVTATGWSVGAGPANAATNGVQGESVWVSNVAAGQPPRRIVQLGSAEPTVPNTEHIVDLIWTPDASHLVAITRSGGATVHARILLVDVPPSGDQTEQTVVRVLAALPAEVLPGSATIDPDGQRLAFVARSAAAGGSNALSLCALELQNGGTLHNIADLGSGADVPTTAPVAWPSSRDERARDRIVFVAPAPAALAPVGGLFAVFGALRRPPTPSALYTSELGGTPGLVSGQPRRLGTAVNNFGLVWRFPDRLYALAREDDGTLALHSVDPMTGRVADLGVRLPMPGAQGLTELSARWDARHGRVLLRARASDGAMTGEEPAGGPLRAWLVSFIPARAVTAN